MHPASFIIHISAPGPADGVALDGIRRGIPVNDFLQQLGVDTLTATRLLFSLIFVFGIFVISYALRQYINSRVEEPKARQSMRRAVNWGMAVAITLVLGILWLERLGNLSVALGLVTAAAAVALQEVVSSFAGWVLITSGRAFDIGDRIEMGGIRGDVIGFGVLRTTLMEIGNWVKGDQYTGRIVTISNSAVFQNPIYNYTRYFQFLWDELSVPITFDSDFRKAQRILSDVASEHTDTLISIAREELEEMARHFRVSKTELRPLVFITFDDNWVELSLRYVTEAKRRRITRHTLSEKILDAISREPDIRFASETMDVTMKQSRAA
jgi:small-conductance mechanosensitive channel